MNCKPGDLAIVIRSRTPSNLGLIVEVVRTHSPVDSGIIPMDSNAPIWLCESKGSHLTWAAAYSIGSRQQNCGPIPDECLRPITDMNAVQAVQHYEQAQVGDVVIAQQTACCTHNSLL